MVEAPVAVGAGQRLVGLDVARAAAFAGMLLAHFARSHGGDPGWLQAVDNVADGRAAPLFCALLGVGAGILLSRGRTDAAVVRRGAALFALGLLLWPFVPQVYVILPHYGLLLVLVPLLRRLPDRMLLPAAGVAFAVPSLVVAAVADHGMRAGRQPDTYGEMLDVGYLAGHLLWTGGYPLVGWVGFVLVGLWLSRLPLGARPVQRRLALGGLALTALQPALVEAQQRSDGALVAALLETEAHSNHLGWYVVSSASAVAVVAACLLVAHRVPPALRSVPRLGRVLLSAYVLHLAIGVWFVWDWIDASEPALAVQMAVAAAVLVLFAVAADRWVGRFARGPLEAVLRFLAP